MATQQTAPTQYLTVQGIPYAYRIIGNATNGTRPLLMLNHFRSNIDLWDPELINNLTLTHGRQLITYDYAGHGHSGGPVATSIRAMSTNLIGFLHALLLLLRASSVDVLGFSVGGYVAQQAVLDQPDIFTNLVLAGTGPSLGPGLERPMAETQSAIMAPTPMPMAAILAFFPSIAYQEGEAWLNRSFAGRSDIAGKNGEPPIAGFLTGPGVLNLTQAYLSWDSDGLPYSLLQTIQNAVLVTAGQNDLVVPSQNSYVLAHQLPAANMIRFPASGHGHLFQYAGFAAAQISDFLDGGWPKPPFTAGVVDPLGA